MAKNAVASAASAVKMPPHKRGGGGSVHELIKNSANLKRLMLEARERGTISVDQINAALPDDDVSPELLEDLMTAFDEMGVTVSGGNDGANGEAKDTDSSDDDDDGGSTVDDLGRTDDPVRMYLREMGSIELLSREGEIEIAKRIEAGRNTVLEALCESPLTMRAIISWRDAIREGKVLLRDVIDLEATYGGGPQEEDGSESEDGEASEAKSDDADEAEQDQDEDKEKESAKEDGEEDGEGEEDDEFDDGTLSLSAMEASVRDGVISTFDKIADTYERLRELQQKRLDRAQNNKPVDQKLDGQYEKARTEVVELVNLIQLNPNRVDSLVDQLYQVNRRLNALEGKLLRHAESCKVGRQSFLKE
jgi:RNA polymerase primary sigma factor